MFHFSECVYVGERIGIRGWWGEREGERREREGGGERERGGREFTSLHHDIPDTADDIRKWKSVTKESWTVCLSSCKCVKVFSQKRNACTLLPNRRSQS